MLFFEKFQVPGISSLPQYFVPVKLKETALYESCF